MPSGRSFYVIFNPAAGRGRARKLVDVYRPLLTRYLGEYDHVLTARPGEEGELTDRALEAGYEAIVAVGGDGTWGAVADRIVRAGTLDVTLGLLPAGTGNDFGKSLGVRADRAEAVIKGMADGHRRTIDVGRAGDRYFLNVVGFGFDIAVIDDAASFPILQGDILYQFCALRQLFKFRGIPIELTDAGGMPSKQTHLMLTISNGNFFGGSFHIAPDARLDDGMLDAVSIYNVGPINRARLFASIAKGKHCGHEQVGILQSPRFTVTFETPVRYEVDGEVFVLEGTSIEIEAVPKALNVFVPSGD
jgi:diacylglycerol kinase (ATP)